MGTETKSNSYTGQISTSGGNPKVMKDSLSLVRQTVKQQQSNSNQIHFNLNSNSNSNSNSNTNSNSNLYSSEQKLADTTTTLRQPTKQEDKTTTTTTQTTTTTTQTTTTTTQTTTKDSIVPFVPIFVEEADVIQGAKDLLKVIRPNWDLNHVDFKKFTDGITNKLVGCFHNSSTKLGNDNNDDDNESYLSNNKTTRILPVQSEEEDSGCPVILQDEDEFTATTKNNGSETHHLSVQYSDNVVLVRVYGNKTDLLIDRKAETQNFQLLHTYGLAPSLYATFKNGLVYEYVPGNTLNIESVLSPEIWPLVARRMAEMHRVVQKKNTTKQELSDDQIPLPMIWTKTQSFFDLVPERFSDADKHKRVKGTFLPIGRLREEFNNLYKYLVALESPIVFSHNDLLLGNVIYTKSLNTVNFIDYEYADYNFQAFDIGNHFTEMCGIDEVDYTRYPKREFQLQWLRVYLENYLQRSNIQNEEVEHLFVQVNQFALASHIFWTVWSLLQAEHSTIDFDYVGYAFLRYNEYLARKDEFLSLTASKNNK